MTNGVLKCTVAAKIRVPYLTAWPTQSDTTRFFFYLNRELLDPILLTTTVFPQPSTHISDRYFREKNCLGTCHVLYFYTSRET